jgi:hypothetical protein
VSLKESTPDRMLTPLVLEEFVRGVESVAHRLEGRVVGGDFLFEVVHCWGEFGVESCLLANDADLFFEILVAELEFVDGCLEFVNILFEILVAELEFVDGCLEFVNLLSEFLMAEMKFMDGCLEGM